MFKFASALAAFTFGLALTALANEPLPDLGKMNGFAVAVWEPGDYDTVNTPAAFDEIAALGAGWISIHPTFYQDGRRATGMRTSHPKGDATPTMDELRRTIRFAHERGLKVLLKPHVDLTTPYGWRGEIGRNMSKEEKATWFTSYTQMIVAQATLAQEESVAMFAVGTEFSELQGEEEEWREVVNAVRRVYSGPLTYAANHGTEHKIKWWDAVDYIGVDAYYTLSKNRDASVEELERAWKPINKRLERLSQKVGRPIIFTEIGYLSRDGTTAAPYDWLIEGEIDMEEQRRAYEAFFNAVYDRPWLQGVFFWRWDVDPEGQGAENSDFPVEGKPAADVVKEWFSRE